MNQLDRPRRPQPTWTKIQHTSPKVIVALALGSLLVSVALVLLVAEWSTPDGVAVLSGADLPGIGRTIGLIFAAAIAVPGVLLAYRRQKSLDDSNNLKAEADYRATEKNYDDRRDSIIRDRRTRFDSIAERLAAPALVVRLAAVASMEALADEWLADLDVEEDQRQREAQACVNVLCSYVRSPFDSEIGLARPASLAKKVVKDTTGTEEHHEYPIDDREVRVTIVRILAAHLRKLPVVDSVRRYPGPWSFMDIDLTGAYLHDAFFARCVFDGRVTFDGAQFTGEYAVFTDAVFSGVSIRFSNATFECARSSFQNVKFSGGEVWFSDTIFSSRQVHFDNLQSTGNVVHFRRTVFTGDMVEFPNATFSGGGVIFGAAKFTNCVNVEFSGAKFIGNFAHIASHFRDNSFILFRGAKFTAKNVLLNGMRFKNSTADFSGCDLSGARTLPTGGHSYDDKTIFPPGLTRPAHWAKWE